MVLTMTPRFWIMGFLGKKFKVNIPENYWLFLKVSAENEGLKKLKLVIIIMPKCIWGKPLRRLFSLSNIIQNQIRWFENISYMTYGGWDFPPLQKKSGLSDFRTKLFLQKSLLFILKIRWNGHIFIFAPKVLSTYCTFFI